MKPLFSFHMDPRTLSEEFQNDVLDVVTVGQTFDFTHDRTHELTHGSFTAAFFDAGIRRRCFP